MKIRSIIISPHTETEEVPQRDQVSPVLAQEETLKDYQNKERRRVRKTAQSRPVRNSPNILRGTSSKKRKLSQIQNSPAGGEGPPRGGAAKAQKRANKGTDKAGPSHAPGNPPIQLIPAATKRKTDFRLPRPLGP